MTNKELYQATFSQVHGEVRQADFPRRKRRSPRTFAALAAAIMLAAALSATAVAEDWFGLRQAALPQGDAGSGVEEGTEVLSLQGWFGSPEYQAAADWQDFLSHYDDGGALEAIGNGDTGLSERYLPYGVWTEEMAETLDAIAAKYNLALHQDSTIYDDTAAFLAVTGAWKRGGEEEVRFLLEVLNEVTRTPESELSSEMRKARLNIYQDCNDAFRKLLLGKFGRLPLGFPADWVYESAFGSEWKSAIANRTEVSPLESLPDVNLAAEEAACTELLKRKPTKEEFVLYLNHPADALKTMQFRMQYGDPNNLPLHVWFEGLKPGQDLYFNDRSGKPHHLLLLSISRPNDAGVVICRYVLDSEIMSCEVQVAQPTGQKAKGLTMADPANKFHVASPSNGDLWVMYVHPGDIVKAGEELFNVSIMKQEKAVLAPVDGVVKRVLKTADFKENKQMVSVREGELLVELGPVPRICSNEACAQPIPMDNVSFCPYCGSRVI